MKLSRFRVLVHPVSASGLPVPNPSGHEWPVTVDAFSREAAGKLAAERAGFKCVVVDTERLDDVEPANPPRAKRQRKPVAADLARLGVMTGDVFAATKGGSHV